MKEKMTMDLFYANPSPQVRDEIKLLGGEIEDVSDYIHEERVAINYPVNKKQEYLSILMKNGVFGYSLSYLTNLLGGDY